MLVVTFFLARISVPLWFFVSANVAEAGIISGLFGMGAQAQSVEKTTSSAANSQKMPLLEAPLNPQPQSADNRSTVSTQDGALVSAKPQSEASGSNKITSYTVQKGDTLSAIAAKFDVTVATVLYANNLTKSSTISPGQKLVILPISGISYKVVKGDNISSISAKFKADTKEILAFNNIDDSDEIKIGDTLIIPNVDLNDPQVAAKASATAKVAATVKKVASAVSGVSTASAQTAGNGYYSRPISGGTRTQGIHGHNAVDLADSCGTPIYASAAGTVEIALANGAWNGGYGNYVVIDHDNGSQTLSAHMQIVSVTEGGRVSQGQQIGTIGSTGEVHGATGCHVHFEIRGGGVANPF